MPKEDQLPNNYRVGFLQGQIEQKEADRAIQLAIFGHEEIATEAEMLGMLQMRRLTGNYGMIVEQLEKHFPKQHTKAVIRMIDKVKRIELWMYNTYQIFLNAQWPKERYEKIMAYFQKLFGAVRSIIVSLTRSPRTMIAADTKVPKMIAEGEYTKDREEKALELHITKEVTVPNVEE